MTWLYSMSEGHQQANDKANITTKTMTIDEVILAHRHAYYADWKLLLRESVVGRKIFFMAGKKTKEARYFRKMVDFKVHILWEDHKIWNNLPLDVLDVKSSFKFLWPFRMSEL